MSRIFIALAVTASLGACDSANPFMTPQVVDPGVAPVIDPDNPVNANGIPEILAENLNSVAFDPVAGTLSVDMAALDRNDADIPLEAYTPNPGLATPAMTAQGYQVFSYQDDGLDRMFVAIVAQSPDGSVVGAVVVDGGQFNKFFPGGFYATDGNYTPGNPVNDTGLVSYAGTYAGLLNGGGDGSGLIGVPVGTPEELLPSQPAQIVGSIFLNADFGDNSVNGAIYNRALVNVSPALVTLNGGTALESVFLQPAAITDVGTFFGSVEDDEKNVVGSFGGTFGGNEATAVAGTTNLDGDFIENFANEQEFGVFVLTQCGQPGEAAICDNIPVNPNP